MMKRSYTIKNIFISLFLLTLFVPAVAPVFAQNIPAWIPCNGVVDPNSTNPSSNHVCTFNDLVTGSQALANEIVQIGLIISPLIFAYAGFLYLRSGFNGSAGDRKTANGIFVHVIVGIAIMLCAWAIVSLILTALVNPTILNGTFPFSTQ